MSEWKSTGSSLGFYCDGMHVVLRIRLALYGCRNRPIYHIVVAQNTAKRDGRHIEQVNGRPSSLVALGVTTWTVVKGLINQIYCPTPSGWLL